MRIKGFIVEKVLRALNGGSLTIVNKKRQETSFRLRIKDEDLIIEKSVDSCIIETWEIKDITWRLPISMSTTKNKKKKKFKVQVDPDIPQAVIKEK